MEGGTVWIDGRSATLNFGTQRVQKPATRSSQKQHEEEASDPIKFVYYWAIY